MAKNYESIVVILIIILFLFIWINNKCSNILWTYIDKFVAAVTEYYNKVFDDTCPKFPKCEIPVLYRSSCPKEMTIVEEPETSCQCSSSKTTSDNSKNQIININTCESSCTPCTKKNSDYCGNIICDYQKSVIFGQYKYCIDSLPGIIYKYSLDECGNVIQSSKTIINHNLGILKRIYVRDGSLYVEDSFSVEHKATIESNGDLTF